MTSAPPQDESGNSQHPWSGTIGDPWAVVAMADTINGIQTVRVLARHGIRIIGLISDSNEALGRTRLCEKIEVADPEGPELIETLQALGAQLGQKAVLFPANEEIVAAVSRNRKDLASAYHIALPSEDVVDIMQSKRRFYEYAEANGLPVPRTVIVSQTSDLEQAIDSLTFPCVVKPQRKTEAWFKFTKHKAIKVGDAAELRSLYAACNHFVGKIVVQEWIVGDSTNLFSCNLYMNADSKPLATFIARKLRQWPPDTGSSSSGEECRNDTVLDLALAFFKSTKCRGLAYLEVKRDVRDGRHVIIEPNIGRPTGRSSIAEAGGVDLLHTMYCDLLGRPLPANRVQTYSGVKWIYLRWDLQSALVHWWRGDLTFAAWIRSMRGRKAYALFSLKDPGPFLWDICEAIQKVVGHLWTRLRDGIGRRHD